MVTSLSWHTEGYSTIPGSSPISHSLRFSLLVPDLPASAAAPGLRKYPAPIQAGSPPPGDSAAAVSERLARLHNCWSPRPSLGARVLTGLGCSSITPLEGLQVSHRGWPPRGRSSLERPRQVHCPRGPASDLLWLRLAAEGGQLPHPGDQPESLDTLLSEPQSPPSSRAKKWLLLLGTLLRVQRAAVGSARCPARTLRHSPLILSVTQNQGETPICVLKKDKSSKEIIFLKIHQHPHVVPLSPMDTPHPMSLQKTASVSGKHALEAGTLSAMPAWREGWTGAGEEGLRPAHHQQISWGHRPRDGSFLQSEYLLARQLVMPMAARWLKHPCSAGDQRNGGWDSPQPAGAALPETGGCIPTTPSRHEQR